MKYGLSFPKNLDSFYREMDLLNPPLSPSSWEEDKSNFYLKLDLPGFEKSAFKINLKSNQLEILAHQKSDPEKDRLLSTERQIHYTMALPRGIVSEKISADYRAGVLMITLPKVEISQPTIRQITVSSSD